MLYLGPLVSSDTADIVRKKTVKASSQAGTIFQNNILSGFCENDADFEIINVLPVGTWPNYYNQIHLKDHTWTYRGHKCYELGCINLPVIKQVHRYWKAKRALRNNTEHKEIVICTAYLPFLKAVSKLPKSYKITAIITDIPEFYDLHKVTLFRKLLRYINNILVYRSMERVDRFIVLTEQMIHPLRVSNRPYMVMEGICDKELFSQNMDESKEEYILYCGRLNEKYGLRTLLEAFTQMNNSDYQLWLCGSGEMEDEIKRQADVNSKIKYLGLLPHKEVIELERRASILVNPRTNDGEYTKYSFPSKTMEYMASGTPVLMHKLDGIPDEYDPYLLYIHDSTVEGMKKSLEEVSNMNPDIRERIGIEARKFVQSTKNSKIQTKKILDFIAEEKL